MPEEKSAVNTTPAAAPEIAKTATVDDYEAKVATLEAEKAKLIEENANWKLATLKAKGKIREENTDETEEERFRRIAREEAVNVKISNLDAEKEALLRKALKENSELKKAFSGQNPYLASVGTHNESPQVQDTLVTPEQLAAFKARGWNDKDIERYKKSYRKSSGR